MLIVPESPPDEGTFFVVGFNEQWLAVILYALQSLNNTYVWDSPPDNITEQVQELIYLFQVDLD